MDGYSGKYIGFFLSMMTFAAMGQKSSAETPLPFQQKLSEGKSYIEKNAADIHPFSFTIYAQNTAMNRAIPSEGKEYRKEILLSSDFSKNHDLDNNDNFSPDGKWLVYDTRTESGGIGACSSIERIHTESGKTEILYHLAQTEWYGPGVGAVSYHPTKEQVIFIHGLMNATPELPYQQWRRTGVMIDTDQPGVARFLDARDITAPFTPGALRGGTHRHEWSRDGKWVGYTYNDAILQSLESETSRSLNLRTIAVSAPYGRPAVVNDEKGEHIQGEYTSVVVVRVVPNPTPGSDEISHAASDSWVGSSGFLRSDGTRQVARAFLGRVLSEEGLAVDELFVVDIPEAIHLPGEAGPLEGTTQSMPAPPAGAQQRRLTYTANSPYPGCYEVVRSSPDGNWISFVSKDREGIKQLYVIPPTGGIAQQVTFHSSDVQSGARWSHFNDKIIYVCENSIMMCEISEQPFSERAQRLTEPSAAPPSNLVWSADGSQIAFNRTERYADVATKQIYIVNLNSH